MVGKQGIHQGTFFIKNSMFSGPSFKNLCFLAPGINVKTLTAVGYCFILLFPSS